MDLSAAIGVRMTTNDVIFEWQERLPHEKFPHDVRAVAIRPDLVQRKPAATHERGHEFEFVGLDREGRRIYRDQRRV